jgi:V/A-type H+-transporting ATPase subunit D
MPTRLKLVPTKSNLLRIKRDLSFAQEGYELLEQKRQVLVAHLMPLVNDAITTQERLESALHEAYQALQNAIISCGKSTVKSIARAVRIESEVQIHSVRVMGVVIPKVEVKIIDNAPYYSVGNSSFWIDESIQFFKQILEAMERYAELRVAVLRLAQEVRKTQRRVNALEKIAIPDYQETLKFISEALEESERGALTTLKFTKEHLARQKGHKHAG